MCGSAAFSNVTGTLSMWTWHNITHHFLSSAAAGNNTYRIHCSIDLVARAAFYAYPNTMTNMSSDLETVDVSWITCVNCSFRMKAISPKLGSNTWHNIIYTSQNNFKSSSTTQNWRKLQHSTILSCWHHFCMLRLSNNSYLDDSTHEFCHFFMIPHTNFGEWSLGGNDAIPTHYYYWPI